MWYPVYKGAQGIQCPGDTPGAAPAPDRTAPDSVGQHCKTPDSAGRWEKGCPVLYSWKKGGRTMKLATALAERAELQTRIQQLHSRLLNNAQVQEGEQPAEDPQEPVPYTHLPPIRRRISARTAPSCPEIPSSSDRTRMVSSSRSRLPAARWAAVSCGFIWPFLPLPICVCSGGSGCGHRPDVYKRQVDNQYLLKYSRNDKKAAWRIAKILK